MVKRNRTCPTCGLRINTIEISAIALIALVRSAQARRPAQVAAHLRKLADTLLAEARE
jgi:transcriptional regulator NrdR family protein